MRIDPRAGSAELIPLMKQRGVKEVESAMLSAGDIHITGNGPGGLPIMVGIEYKKLPDLVQCIEDGRFVGHQLPNMLDCYDQNWLLVEGIWRESDTSGLLEVPRGSSWTTMRHGANGGLMAGALEAYLLTLSIKLGLNVKLTGGRRQTVNWLYHLNRWWTEKEYEDHRAYLAFDNSSALALVSTPSLVRRVAKELPGVGWHRSGAVASHFGSVVELALAEPREWESISGIGKETARRVFKAINGGGE